jgi:nucleoside recognition membrane protein YjiH
MPSKSTISIGFRITTAQHTQLTQILQPYTISSSSIVRALLQLFIEGKCPDALTIALSDMQRAEKEGGVRKNG